MKRTPWVPLDANFQDDGKLIDVSADAELVYLRSLGLTKRLDEDGDRRILPGHLRRLCDKLESGADPSSRRVVAEELVSCGAWSYDADSDSWWVTAWDSWNVSLTEAKRAKVRGAKAGNHKRHKHAGPVDNCEICYPQGHPDVSPGSSLVAKRPVSDSLSDRHALAETSLDVDVDEIRREKKGGSVSTVQQRPPTTNSDDTHPQQIASLSMQKLGYTDRQPTQGDVRTIERALSNGWEQPQLIARAELSAHKAEPLTYWRTCIQDAANHPPPDDPPAPETTAQRLIREATAINKRNGVIS